MNIILDIDGTLIECFDDDSKITERPYLKQFFKYIFEKFESVSIYTHAKQDWCDEVCKKCLNKLIPEGKQFDFIWTRSECITEYFSESCYSSYSNIEITIIKPLQKVYDKFPNYNEFNTFILDDTPSTYRDNIENSIKINSFTGKDNDKELLRVVRYLNKHLFPKT